MKKRRLSILLSIVMLLSLLPTTALAAAYADVEVNGVTLSDGKYLASNSTKTANNSSTEPATYVAWYKDGVLTLNDYDGKYIQVNGALKSDLTVKLKGSNTITRPIVGEEFSKMALAAALLSPQQTAAAASSRSMPPPLIL